MNENEANELAWLAFNFGVRVAIHAYGVTLGPEEQNRYLNVLYAISKGNITLNEPADMAARFPNMAETFMRIGNLSVQRDHELAQRVYEGFDNAAKQIIDS